MEKQDITGIISREFGISARQVIATLSLLDDGATVPFVARYRKEATGELDEVAIRAIRDRADQLRKLFQRKTAILASLAERELLTPELEAAIREASTLAETEDIYLPYKPKRRTRATIAKEKGLEPLAARIFSQEPDCRPEQEARAFIHPEKEVPDIDSALAGARDIIAEWVNEEARVRARMRGYFERNSNVRSKVGKGKEADAAKFQDYFDFSEPLSRIPSHRMLALRRGEQEGFLSLKIQPEKEKAIALLERYFIKRQSPAADQVRMAISDAYQRLMGPSMENEIRENAKNKADTDAIQVFAENLRQLLLAPPLGQKRVLAIDPGFRTGCKVTVLDRQGQLLDNTTIYPHPPQHEEAIADKTIHYLVEQFKVEAIAVGNGTAGRETETFLREIGLPEEIEIVMVNESGASVYSASDVAREEFPDYDVTVRGAVSIGRRLMDPLAELVKIDPKSIGVGQYQHDVDQTALRNILDDTVMSCVNAVGVEVNTASKQLLTYVSGLGPALAQNIVDYRSENGPFKSRKALLSVPRLGAKAFEQSAGFLRIRNGKNPLDSSAVHPESYPIVERMAKDLGASLADLIGNEALRKKIRPEDYVTENAGLPTLQDILSELAKPGRDPRQTFESFEFAGDVHSPEDLEEGMWLPGIVTNITDFGVFVDVGVHQDGLVHISQLADRFVRHPSEVVKLRQPVQVRVVSVDMSRNRIAFSMKKDYPEGGKPKRNK
jgi:uncharacterized protein